MPEQNFKALPKEVQLAIIQAAGNVAAAAVSRDPGAVEAIGHTESALTAAINALVKLVK